jgi:deoxyribonuclease-4
MHPGSAGAAKLENALDAIADGLMRAVRGLALGELRILMENTAGQGRSVGWRFEHLKAILDACPSLPLGVCLDTAHTFAAGYDICSGPGLERTLAEFDRLLGMERLFVVHVNDSKAPAGSHVDRHEHIGRGRIGFRCFRQLLNHPLIAKMPGRAFILETPIDRPGDDLRNVRALWRLFAKAAPVRTGAIDGFPPRRLRKAMPGKSHPKGTRRREMSVGGARRG